MATFTFAMPGMMAVELLPKTSSQSSIRRLSCSATVLKMDNAHFSFKDYKALYSVNKIFINYRNEEIGHCYWLQFLEKTGAKPVVVLEGLPRESINTLLDQLTKTFFSAVSPTTYKIEFVNVDESLTVFRQMNYRSREKLQLKKKYSTGTYTLKRRSLPPTEEEEKSEGSESDGESSSSSSSDEAPIHVK